MNYGYPANLLAIALLIRRLSAAFLTIPDRTDWLWTTGILFSLTAIALPIGFQQSFLEIDILKTSWEKIADIVGQTLPMTAIAEELIFRVLLLPHPTENPSFTVLWCWEIISLATFLVYHPLNALTFYPAGNPTFMNPVFLLLAGLLGVACAIAYWQSGSLWPPVVIHWLVLVVWILLLGGYRKLHKE